MAALLDSGGVFATFGGPVQLADPAVAAAVRAARESFLESDEVASPDGTPAGQDLQWPGTELERSEWFTDVEQSVTVEISAGVTVHLARRRDVLA